MVLVYTLASIFSAFLVFFIQPVVAKIALPTLGGVPAVWSGCMLFFQAALLCGYLYANVLSNRVRVRYQPFIHVSLLFLALLVFPMQFAGVAGVEPSLMPMAWLLGMLVLSVGLPFFAISATAPLLQRWFSYTDHPDAANPYFLYAASNIGSMSALLLYPFVAEPFFELSQQVWVWEKGVAILALLFVGVAFYLMRRGRPQAAKSVDATEIGEPDETITWAQRGKWVLYSAVPASLLYGVTTYLTTDIAPIPLLWVLPLALYLITFIIVFSSRHVGVALAQRMHLPLIGALFLLLGLPLAVGIWILVLHIVTYYVTILTLHAELSRSKPSARHLTQFFLWMSLGGVMGGVFNTLVAPHVFDTLVEYPLVLLVSCLLRAPVSQIYPQLKRHARLIAICAAGVMISIGLVLYVGSTDSEFPVPVMVVLIMQAALILTFLIKFGTRPVLFTLCLGTLYMAMACLEPLLSSVSILTQERSIFSTYNVRYNKQKGVQQLLHGTTVHGIQSFKEEWRLQPVGYYLSVLPIIREVSGEGANVAVMGLGAGVLSCAGTEGQHYDLYEIDSLMVEIASNPDYFTYIRDCPPEKRIILGDGRMQLANQPDRFYDLVIMDAFNSDAIPVHLITLQAIQMYREKLKPGGMILVHISNRYVDLRPALSTIAHAIDMDAFTYFFTPKEELGLASRWVAITSDSRTIAVLENDGWDRLTINNARYLWTDSYSNVFTSLARVQKWLGQLER